MTLLANLVIELNCQNVEDSLFGIETLQTLPSLRSHIMNAYGFSVTCNVTLKCYVTAETSPGNYARCAVQTSL